MEGGVEDDRLGVNESGPKMVNYSDGHMDQEAIEEALDWEEEDSRVN
jgi:hypothetical protein